MRTNSSSGFTLIELLVTASIVTLLIGTGIPAFRRFGRLSALDLAADEAKAVILEARSAALNPRAEKDLSSVSGCVQDTVKTYGVQFVISSTGYRQFEGSCPIGEPGSVGPAPIVISAAPASRIDFSVTTRGELTSPTSGTVSVQLTRPDLPGTVRIITVNRETGAVSITR